MTRPIPLFLAQAVPWPTATDPGYVCICWLSPNPNGGPPLLGQRAFTDQVNASNFVFGMLNVDVDLYVCMAKVTTAVPDVSTRSGKPVRKPIRNEETATVLRGIWLDIDVKPGAFDTTADAKAAFDTFFLKVGLPPPSMLVATGSGGFHAHWLFDTPVSRETWFLLADALKNAALIEGFAPTPDPTTGLPRKLDLGLTTNNACILRIPGTKNWKTRPGSTDVTFMHVANPAAGQTLHYPVALIDKVLTPYKTGATYVARVRAPIFATLPFRPNPKLYALGMPSVKLDAGLDLLPPTIIEIEDVARGCPFIDETLKTGGVGHSEPLWFESLKVAFYCKEGDEVAHELSDGHPTYTEKGTDDKYQQVVFSHANQQIGWPQCRTIYAAGSTWCRTCPHLNTPKASPLTFATALVAQAAPPPTPPPAPPPLAMGVPALPPSSGFGYLPPGYKHLPDGTVAVEEPDPNDATGTKKIWQQVCAYPIYHLRPQAPNDDGLGYFGISFTTQVDATRVRDIHFRFEDIDDPRKFGVGLARQGLLILDKRRIRTLMASFTEQLRANRITMENSEAYGWSLEKGKPAAFCAGRIRFNGTGNTPFAPPDIGIAKLYTPTGSLDEWKKAAALITVQERPDLNAIIAASLAAPLVIFTGNSGMVVSAYTSESGVGKSHAMRVGQSVWGDPVTGMAGFDDTGNYVMERIVKARHFPFMFDELKQDIQHRKLVDMIFAMGQGKQKGRLTTAAEMKEVGSFSTLLVTASNNSVIEYMNEHVRETIAAVNRVFEFPVKRVDNYPGKIDQTAAQRINGSLNYNFGLAGMVYGEFLGKNVTLVSDGVARTSEAFNTLVKGVPDERFGVSTIAILAAAAKYANHLGLTTINEQKLIGFLLDRFYALREYRKTAPVGFGAATTERYLVDYINARRDRTLTTDEVWTGAGRAPSTFKPIIVGAHLRSEAQITIRHAKTTKVLRISKSDFRTWLKKERQISPAPVINALMAMPGVHETKVALGTHTGWATAREDVIEFDLNHINPFTT